MKFAARQVLNKKRGKRKKPKKRLRSRQSRRSSLFAKLIRKSIVLPTETVWKAVAAETAYQNFWVQLLVCTKGLGLLRGCFLIWDLGVFNVLQEEPVHMVDRLTEHDPIQWPFCLSLQGYAGIPSKREPFVTLYRHDYFNHQQTTFSCRWIWNPRRQMASLMSLYQQGHVIQQERKTAAPSSQSVGNLACKAIRCQFFWLSDFRIIGKATGNAPSAEIISLPEIGSAGAQSVSVIHKVFAIFLWLMKRIHWAPGIVAQWEQNRVPHKAWDEAWACFIGVSRPSFPRIFTPGPETIEQYWKETKTLEVEVFSGVWLVHLATRSQRRAEPKSGPWRIKSAAQRKIDHDETKRITTDYLRITWSQIEINM